MSVKSAQRVLQVFECLTMHTEGLSIKEISETLDFPQSSTSNLIKTLAAEGYLRQDTQKKYKLGPKLIGIGTAAMESLDVSAVGKPYLKTLMEEVQETVFMALMAEEELVYVAKIDNNRSIRTTAQPGNKKPIYCTGLGKAFLSFMPEESKNKLLDSTELLPITSHTITSREQMEHELAESRKRGYAIDNEENEEGLFCLAAPIYGGDRQMQAAISVAGPKERMTARKDQIAKVLLLTSKKISASLGYLAR
ncbi:IclR family transcriptional regulator [Fictibacillus enclensis]|uniref:IclR family transcriptional regulator n=1 Tax=Fictibacillus TaxID=1329200 RepID=UPI0010105E81|nr:MULTISPECIES: IclR family transcriptional regulator [Fictibacillus]MDM5197912.1 IclR family transcriptional regulator [Fictibacillus enclensis]MDM5337048.1 IclR family transcriptional regulator [Fictibacillus enclensis]RXZ00118.1 IclR family transcriptional regulator [Fictibacillus sp. S7]